MNSMSVEELETYPGCPSSLPIRLSITHQMAPRYTISPLEGDVTRNHSRTYLGARVTRDITAGAYLHRTKEGLGMTHFYGGLCLRFLCPRNDDSSSKPMKYEW